ncbi:ArsR/SmtB family transcription factor [Streptomyces humi]|uniref:ArsR/SmtB family transcription factor n=1 Tax=Streptomyces humi TaxID=1428620 RepID=UPI0006287880|nr:helix-turn-helix domain-containing protein [Streptomyces humi]
MTDPTDLPQRRTVDDPRRLRALAHPLRLATLQYLMAVGPRTASECAAEVGSTPSNISWHLRHLAEFGLVELTEAPNQRERPWQATQVGFDFGELSTEPVLSQAQDQVMAASMTEEGRLTKRFLNNRGTVDPEWLTVARFDGFVLRATPEELGELGSKMNDLLRPYLATIRQDAPDKAELAYVGLRLFPRLDAAGQTG